MCVRYVSVQQTFIYCLCTSFLTVSVSWHSNSGYSSSDKTNQSQSAFILQGNIIQFTLIFSSCTWLGFSLYTIILSTFERSQYNYFNFILILFYHNHILLSFIICQMFMLHAHCSITGHVTFSIKKDMYLKKHTDQLKKVYWCWGDSQGGNSLCNDITDINQSIALQVVCLVQICLVLLKYVRDILINLYWNILALYLL